MRINKHDTDGTKPLLGKGELGYDDYTAGGDTGRVYVGTGTENIALAERLESNMMTKAQFNALADERKANRAGSGFDEWGKHSVGYSSVNEGIICASGTDYINAFQIGWNFSSQLSGISKTNYPIVNVNGIIHKLFSVNRNSTSYEINKIQLPTAPNIYPYDTVLTAEQNNSGVIKHADASNSGLIVNGKFDTDTSGWTDYSSTLSVDTNRLKIVNNGGVNGSAVQAFSTVVGKKYIVEFNVTSGSNNMGMQIKSTSGGITGWSLINMPTGRYTYEYTATTTTTYLLFSVYSNAAGVYGFIDNVAVYPADAISRSDSVFLESWHEDISEKNFAYDNGNTQSLSTTNTIGVTPVNGNFTGFETYSLFGNWQTPSSLVGKGYVWSNLTEAQRKAFIANPENNCYLDGDKTIQVRYRVRVVQGLGDSWDYAFVLYNTPLQYNSSMLLKPKGKSVSISSDLGNSTGGIYAGFAHVFTDGISVINGDYGITQASSGADILFSGAYEGKCFALPLALVHRRNQGMYHPVYNPNGSKKASDDKFWYDTSVSFTSISDCFNPAKLLTASGYIGSVSGRPDGLFYDQVHESDITDLRNSSKKVEDYSRLINREFNKLVTGTTRGKEGEWKMSSYIGLKLTALDTNSGNTNFNNYAFPVSVLYNGFYGFMRRQSDGLLAYIYKATNSSSLCISTTKGYYSGTFPYAVNDTLDVYLTQPTTRTKSNTLLHCDIIGNPTNYPTSWKESGVFGTPLIVAEDGTSLLPDGVKTTFKASRKASTQLLFLKSSDNGATWTFLPYGSGAGQCFVNTTTNNITFGTALGSNDLAMIFYSTKTSMAVPVANSEVLEYGKVIGTNGLSNAHLVSTLIGKVSTANTAPYLQMGYDINGYRIDTSTIKWSTTATEIPVHSALSLGGGASGVATVKVLPYLTRINGKAYLNLVFKEMKHNDTSWGDDTKFNIVDNVSATTDFYGSTVLIGQKTVELPYFIAGDE